MKKFSDYSECKVWVILILLFSSVIAYSQWSLKGSSIYGRDDLGTGSDVDLSSDGSTLAIATRGSTLGFGLGYVEVFNWTGTGWTPKGGRIFAETVDDGIESVSLSQDGDIVAVGAPLHSGRRGQVRVFQWSGSSWTQLGMSLFGDHTDAHFGFTISLSAEGLILAIGSPRHNLLGPYTGQVKVYQFITDTWTQMGDPLFGKLSMSSFGESLNLSADGETLAVGAGNYDNNKGQVRVFKFRGRQWRQIGEEINGDAILDYCGQNVALNGDGNILAVGIPGHDNAGGSAAGQVRIFSLRGNKWKPLGPFINGSGNLTISGRDVSLNTAGDVVAIGSTLNTPSGGYIRVLRYNGTLWQQVGSQITGEPGVFQFGFSISLSADGNTMATGTPFYNSQEGIASVYSYNSDVMSAKSNSSKPITPISSEIINIYPNSALHTLKIEATDLEGDDLSIKLIDLVKGTLMNEFSEKIFAGKAFKEISLLGLVPGEYLVIMDYQGRRVVKKISKL